VGLCFGTAVLGVGYWPAGVLFVPVVDPRNRHVRTGRPRPRNPSSRYLAVVRAILALLERPTDDQGGSLTEFMLFARVVLRLLCYIIGWEPAEYRGSAAGRSNLFPRTLRTAFTALRLRELPPPRTAEKLIAGVVTGVGFPRGRLILKVTAVPVLSGLTTAAL